MHTSSSCLPYTHVHKIRFFYGLYSLRMWSNSLAAKPFLCTTASVCKNVPRHNGIKDAKAICAHSNQILAHTLSHGTLDSVVVS